MWVIVLIVIAAIVYFVLIGKGGSSAKSKEVENAKIQWREPRNAVEHLIYLAHMGEAISSFESYTVRLWVEWTWGEGINDKVHMTFYGVNETGIYRNTDSWKYLSENSTEIYESRYFDYEFSPRDGGAPACFRGKNDILEFVRLYAPSAYCDSKLQFGDNDSYDAMKHQFREWAHISFERHDLDYKYSVEKLDETIIKAFERGV